MCGRVEGILDAGRVMEMAVSSAGLEDFGDAGFVKPLEKYLAAAGRYFPFSESQAEKFAAGIVNDLINRLRMNADLKRHPEILDEDVSDPIVITGLPRTGTTKLQRVLSADPANQALHYWKVINFARFSGEVRGEPAARIAVAKAACDQMATDNPEFMTGHPFLHDQAEEECLILGANFDHGQNSGFIRDESYGTYIQSLPRKSSYCYLHTVLQYLQWQQGGKRGPWILKTPQHLGYLREVLATFPCATIVQGHRDSVTAFGSLCHLSVDLVQPAMLAKRDRQDSGRDLFRFWGEAWDRNEAEREILPQDLRFIDVEYEEIRDDAISVAKRIYAVAGRSLSEEGRVAIEKWEIENKKDRFGRHEYQLEDYGLNAAQVEKRFRLRTQMRRG